MTGAYAQVTRENLQSLKSRKFFDGDTPPPTSQQSASNVDVERFKVRGLMTALQRYVEGRQYLQQLGVHKLGFDGILYSGLEPTLADLEDLSRKLRAKVDILKLQDPPAKKLEEAKNSVLNILLELFHGGLSYHLVLVQEQDVKIDDYVNPKIRFGGSKKDRDSPTW